MVAYSYQEQFIAPIEAGTKRQTMRNERKRHARPGEEIQHYYAMRTKHCRLIGRSICTAVTPVHINFHKFFVNIGGRKPYRLRTKMDFIELDKFARLDGFPNWGALRAFWAAKHETLESWAGVLIEWKDFQPGEVKP